MHAYGPNGRVKLFQQKAKEVTAETLVDYISKCRLDHHHMAHVICGVYEADFWIQHLERVMSQYPRHSYENVTWCKQFIDAYIEALNLIEKLATDQTGVQIG